MSPVSNMEIITLPVGQMQANCYLYVDGTSSKTIIIDPGDDADFIERKIADRNLKPEMIVATHGHFDHIMAVIELSLAYKIPFKANCEDRFLIRNMKDSAKHFLNIDPGPSPEIDDCLNDEGKINSGKNILEVMKVPGHTPGSICLYDKFNKILFTGDTLFADGAVGRTDFSYSKHGDLISSLKKIFKLSPKTQILPGHGRPSSLEEEKIHHNL